jgi:uncharacterized repeat protein (TIGR01451 family)
VNEAYWRIFVSNVLPTTVSDAVFFDRLPNTADGDDFSAVLAGPVAGAPEGSTVEYSTDATSAASGVWTSDPAGAVAFRLNVPSMATGQTFTLIVPTAVDGEAASAQTADNQVSATAAYKGAPVAFESNEAAVTIAAAPGLSIVKTTNGMDVPSIEEAPVVAEGGAVQWSYVVTNTGNTALTGVTVADQGGPGGTPGTSVDIVAPVGFDGGLEAGESVTFTAFGTAISGLYENVATATGTPADGAGTPIPEAAPVSATDSSWYTGGAVDLAVAKEVSTGKDGPWAESVTAPAGSTVFWRVAVTNVGGVPLNNVVVSDPLATSFTNQTIETLAVGETKTFLIEHRLAAGLTNVATASVDINAKTLAAADEAAAHTTAAASPGVTPPSATPPSATTPVAPAPAHNAGKSRDGLALTGFGASPMVTAAVAILLAGVAALVLFRRATRRNL